MTSSRFRTHPFTSAANEYGKLASSKMSALKCFKKVAFSLFSSHTRRKKHQQKKNIIVPLSKDLYTYENSLCSINFPSVFVTKTEIPVRKIKESKTKVKVNTRLSIETSD